MALTSGATFAGYSVLRSLGRGEMGDVYLTQHPRLPHWNALKVLSATLTEDREFRDRFMRETPIATTLYHPHILEVEYRGETDGQLWVTMDYVNGTSAAQLIANRFPTGMPAGEVLATITAVADALDYAHSRGMLHRNVRPANILFASPADGEQQILLTDFGMARQLGDPNGAPADLTGEAVAYAAPEQLSGSDIDGRADQYALAATAFHLLTGAPPFQQSNPVAVIGQHLTAAPPSLHGRRPDLARLDDILATALAKNPHDRFHSCRAFADALSYSAGAWTGDRSPEAYLTVVDYPDDMPEAQPAMGDAAPSGVFPAWARTVRRLAQHHATTGQPVGADGSTAPAAVRRRRWPWVVGLGSAAAALCVGLLGVGIVIGRDNDAGPKQAAGPLKAIRSSAPAAAPTTTNSRNFPGPGEALDGSYRVDVNREQQTYDSTPDPQPPNVSTWWAFRTSCTPTACVATGTMLDDKDHQNLSPAGGDKPIVLDFRDGAWQSRPDKVLFACLGPNGAPAQQTTTQEIRLEQKDGALRGTMTVTVNSDECSQQGATIEIPTVAARVAEVPSRVQVPSAPSTAPPAPATTRPTR
ncbi:MAG: serine/threonine-protein kinase [Mycobacterium sp.]|uniref:serine/threonine-protein kinase n=1 Tax=Mycobacterium sp. TaxID=1785 RepID=UPI003BB18759